MWNTCSVNSIIAYLDIPGLLLMPVLSTADFSPVMVNGPGTVFTDFFACFKYPTYRI